MDIGQLLCVGLSGPRLSPGERRLLKRLRPGAVNLFRRNYEDPAQLSELCAQIHRAFEPAPLIGVDQEGGRVVRFGAPFIRLEAARDLARRHSPAEVMRLAKQVAAELRAVGVDINFAPVLDVVTNPANEVIGDRAFGTTSARVARYGLAFMRGLMRGGVVPCPKHFPGHGHIKEDSHRELPVSSIDGRSLFGVHLKPFAAAIAAGTPMVMAAHLVVRLVDPVRPATLSPAFIRELLRGRLRFGGVVATDDLRMEALAGFGTIGERTVLALEAGADLVLLCGEISSSERAYTAVERVARDPRRRGKLGASLKRISELRRKRREYLCEKGRGSEAVGAAGH